jgi:hypothetical protein
MQAAEKRLQNVIATFNFSVQGSAPLSRHRGGNINKFVFLVSPDRKVKTKVMHITVQTNRSPCRVLNSSAFVATAKGT